MRKLIFAVILSALTTTAAAQTPPDVLKEYKAYNAAMQSNDFSSAIKHAKAAWKNAEKSLGDNATTGDLAYNYGYVEKHQGDPKNSIKALLRSAELARLKSEDAGLLRLEREVEAISAMEKAGKGKDASRQIDDALDFVKAQNLMDSVYAGELYVHESSACNRILQKSIMSMKPQIGTKLNTAGSERGRKDGHKKCSKYAERAVDIFSRNKDQTRPDYLAAAHNYVGYSYETNEVWYEAAMSYQAAREAVETAYGRDHPLVAKSIGRWLNARNFLSRLGKLEYAEANGLCRCWPYEQTDPKINAVASVTPNYPAGARQSGYAIMQFDVSDSGKTENIRILHSWPNDFYDKSSIKALEKWEYAPKTGSEPADFRKAVTVPFNYYLSQGLEPI